MSHPIRVIVQVEGATLSDFTSFTLTQELFTHHTFALTYSFEALARALGIGVELVFRQAHQQLSGKPITISWESALPTGLGQRFEFKGIITETSIRTDSDLVNYYHVAGASPTFVLEDGSQSRSFVKQTVGQIFAAVLGDYAGNVFERQLSPRRQAVLPYVAQYDETNFNFLSRLAAQQGEWFYYDGTRLHLGLADKPAALFESSATQSFVLTMTLQPGKLKGSTYNYRTHQPLQATAKAPARADAFSEFALQRSQEVFTQPHRLLADRVLTDASQLQETLDTLAAKHASSLVTLEGYGESFDLVPGSLLDMRDAAGADYGQFRVVAVAHEIDGDHNYQNRFKAMPGLLDTPPVNELYAPPAAHPEVAEVIDLADPRRLGRVRVRFQWLVERPAQAESGWLRVTTPYSGDGKGQMFTPEVGSQVLVSYEHGLPEFPVVVGNVFHPQNKQGAQYSPPNNHLKGLQTAGGNKFVLSDTPGQQQILISNSNNKGTAVEVGFQGDGSITIKSNGPVTVLSPTITLEAGDKGTIKLHAKTITMVAEEEIAASSNARSITLQARQNIVATATEKLELHGQQAARLTSDQRAGLTSPQTVDVGSGQTVNISASTVNQS